MEEKDKKLDELLKKMERMSMGNNGFVPKPRCRNCGRYHFGVCFNQNKSKDYFCLTKNLNCVNFYPIKSV